MEAATQKARDQGGPTLLEFVTYRLTPHSASGDASYVPREELAAAIAREPLPNFRSWLVAGQHMSQQEVDEIGARALALVDDAFEFAVASPPPDDRELLLDVFGDAAIAKGTA